MLKTPLHIAALTVGTLLSSAALAVDVDVNIGGGRPPRPVVVQPSAYMERVWVPERVVTRTERVLIEPARIEKRAERVCVQPAQILKREERVLVEPARIERVKETVLVQPARVGREYVPPVTENVRVGPVNVTRVIREGYWREVPIAAEYRTVYRDVEVPARYETVYRDVEIPARYETVYRDVQIPAQYREVTRNEVIPGHYEERIVTPRPSVVVEPPRPGGIHIEVDLDKKKKRRD
ncbi:MAG TPA: hypothetical protein VEK08_19230 [Planctomycetota bacterium]|nr:hypothetical protein [Planctomycetota bacterium]